MPFAKPKPDPLQHVSVIVDELAALELDAGVIAAQAKIARTELLRKELRAAYAAHSATGTFMAHGTSYLYMVGPKGDKSTVNVVQLAKLVSLRVLCRLAHVTQKALEEHEIPASITGQVLETAPTGPRSLKLLSKAQPPHA